MKLTQETYKDNIKFLRTTIHLVYKALDEYRCLWFNLLKPVNLVKPVLEKNYEDEEVKRIQEKALNFLSKLYSLCKKDEQSKQVNMYEIGKKLGYNATEIEYIVETLSRTELVRYEKSSNKVAITTYGIMMTKGEITVGYAPIL